MMELLNVELEQESILQTVSELTTTISISDEIKQALLQCFQKVAWIDDQGQDYYDALYDALYPPVGLDSISCVYTQSGTVYDTDSLDDLKSDLVVTAHYSDQSTQTITTYTLSGTLAEGTSTITVSYGGKSTTFDVTVTHASQTYLYNWDFTQSLTDSVSSKTAVLRSTISGNAPTRDSSGVHFTEASQIISLFHNDTVSLANGLCGKTVEIDVGTMDMMSGQHLRIFMHANTDAKGGGGLIYRNGSGYFYWSGYSAIDSAWSDPYSADLTGDTSAVKNAFSGKTIKLVYDASGYSSLYVDGVLKGTSTVSHGTTASSYQTMNIGGTYSGTSYAYNMTITGVRIYANS